LLAAPTTAAVLTGATTLKSEAVLSSGTGDLTGDDKGKTGCNALTGLLGKLFGASIDKSDLNESLGLLGTIILGDSKDKSSLGVLIGLLGSTDETVLTGLLGVLTGETDLTGLLGPTDETVLTGLLGVLTGETDLTGLLGVLTGETDLTGLLGPTDETVRTGLLIRSTGKTVLAGLLGLDGENVLGLDGENVLGLDGEKVLGLEGERLLNWPLGLTVETFLTLGDLIGETFLIEPPGDFGNPAVRDGYEFLLGETDLTCLLSDNADDLSKSFSLATSNLSNGLIGDCGLFCTTGFGNTNGFLCDLYTRRVPSPRNDVVSTISGSTSNVPNSSNLSIYLLIKYFYFLFICLDRNKTVKIKIFISIISMCITPN